MTEMTINGIDVSAYNARLLDYSVSGTTVANNISTAVNVLKMPMLFSTVPSARTLTISLTFFPRRAGDNARNTSVPEKLSTAAENITNFERLIVGQVVEITLPDGFIYTAIVQTLAAPTFDSSGEHDVTYTFIAIRHKSTVKTNVAANSNLNCTSTAVTPCKFIITVPNTCNLTINGITVKSVTANKELVIDGIYGLITLDGKNKFLDTDLTDFPVLHPGENLISCSVSGADITVVYTPIYI